MSQEPRLQFFHSTSEPAFFVGRSAELSMLDRAIAEPGVSVIALIGPGGQGKTALVRYWLDLCKTAPKDLQGIFFWSFYRGKDSDLLLRQLYASVAGLSSVPEVSATYCVDHLLKLLREHKWIVALDGTEVVQHETGSWYGRFLHPELGRLLQEAATAIYPGLFVLTSRFAIPELDRRPYARAISLERLGKEEASSLLRMFGILGTPEETNLVAQAAGYHAKAVELLGTLLIRVAEGKASRLAEILNSTGDGLSDEDRVARVLTAFGPALSAELQDILALATAFREPPLETAFLTYLRSGPVEKLLHQIWQRTYPPFAKRSESWLQTQIDELLNLRLLERVRGGIAEDQRVLDAHPLVRRTFERIRSERPAAAQARADFLRGRPDRRPPTSLVEAQPEIELFHAYSEGGLWQESDQVLTFLDRPRYRFLAPALEQELLSQFFPERNWLRPPLWSGFRRYRDLAICLEMQGRYEEALPLYRGSNTPLVGDALLALGRLEPFLQDCPAPVPWQMLWQAYQAHALCLAGRVEDAVRLCRRLVPQDIYEWIHVFECLLRAGRLDAVDMNSFLYRPPSVIDTSWTRLARERMRADYLRVTGQRDSSALTESFAGLLEEYDRSGLPLERVWIRLSFAQLVVTQGDLERADRLAQEACSIAARHQLTILEADSWTLLAAIADKKSDGARKAVAQNHLEALRKRCGYLGPARP